MLALVGAGSLGQAFAALLARSGQPVTLLATPRTAAQLAAAGRILVDGAASAEAPLADAPAPRGVIGIAVDPGRLPRGTAVIFATKAHQLAGAARAVRAAWPVPEDGAAWVAGLQNGVAKDDLLAETFGPERVVGAVTMLSAVRQADGRITVTAVGKTYLGELAGTPGRGHPARVATAIEALDRAGLPAEEPADMRSATWSKACNAAGAFGVSVLCRASAQRLFHDPDLVRAYLSLVREAAAVAAAHGVPVGDFAGFPIRTFVTRPDEETVARLIGRDRDPAASPTAAEIFPSMTQDLLAGRALEVDQVFGDLVERGERAGVAVPRLRLVRDLLRGLDPGRHGR